MFAREGHVGEVVVAGAVRQDAKLELLLPQGVGHDVPLVLASVPFLQRLTEWCAASKLNALMLTGDQRVFDFRSISPNATPIEVFRQLLSKPILFQCLTRNSPNQLSHQVRRIAALRDRFQAFWRQGQCSAPHA